MTFHGEEFEFNPFRVEDAEKLDAAQAHFAALESSEPPAASLADNIRYKCRMFDEALGILLGGDYAQKLHTDTTDLLALSRLYYELIAEAKKELQSVAEEMDALKAGSAAPAASAPPAALYQPHGRGKRRRR